MKDVNVENIVKESLQLEHESIRNLGIIGGMTNLNYLVEVEDEKYIVRIPGNGTSSIIDRQQELQNLKLGSSIGINPELIYFNVDSGVKITQKIAHSRPLTEEEMDDGLVKKVAKILKKLHSAEEKMKNPFNLFELMDEYEMLAIEARTEFYEGFHEVKDEIKKLQERYHKMLVDQTSCHIDPACSNFLINDDGDVYLIDWEYGGVFDPLWDVAAFSLESRLSPVAEKDFLKHYFKREVTVQEQERILMHKIFQDYLWSIWTLFKEEKGDNFGLYGRLRFERAKENIQTYHSLYELESNAQ